MWETTLYGTPCIPYFCSVVRRVQYVAHPNLYTFLGHLQHATADSETDIARLNRGMSIRRSKKRTNLINEARIKACISRFDSGAYTRVQFLRAVSHSVGAYAVQEDRTADSDAEDEVRNDSDSDQPQSAVSEPQSRDLTRGVSGSAARHTTCFCVVRASAFLCFLRRLA